MQLANIVGSPNLRQLHRPTQFRTFRNPALFGKVLNAEAAKPRCLFLW